MRSLTFDLLADAEPGTLPRLLAPFARRDLTPDAVRARRVGALLQATISCDAVPADILRALEGSLRAVVGVRRVEVLLRAAVRAVA